MTDTGIAPGFGGFAVTPAGQAQYLERLFNPYGFLQQPVYGTAPGASDAMLARGGDVRRPRWQRLDEGGDADGTGGLGAAGGTNGGFGGADAPGNGPGMDGGPGTGEATTVGGISSPAAGMNGMLGGLTTAGQPSSLGADPFGISQEVAPSMAQLGYAGAKAGLSGVVPGLGLASNALGLGKGAANAMGIGPMGPGAQMGAGIMGTIGGIAGGPGGAALGAMIGAEMGSHGTSGPGLGGASSNAGLGAGTQDGTQPTAASTDIASLIQRIHGAMTQQSPAVAGLGALQDRSPLTQGLAQGGMVSGQGGPNHNFHAGSGLVHGSSDGRADALHMHVPRGGYVIPADVVSGLGQGNTMAGAKKLRGLMPSKTPGFAAGGSVPVRLSSGEFFIHPAHVAAMGHGDLKAGSDKLDQMVGHVRRISAGQVARMPAPR